MKDQQIKHMKSGHSKGRKPHFFKNRFFVEKNS